MGGVVARVCGRRAGREALEGARGLTCRAARQRTRPMEAARARCGSCRDVLLDGARMHDMAMSDAVGYTKFKKTII